MKKLLIFLLAVGFSATTFAQGIDLGIKAGVNFASISDATGLDNRTGFVVGAFAGAKLNDNLGVQADLLYSQQGAEFDGGKIDLNYVNVPVVLKYFVTETIHVHAGPQFGFIVDDNVANVFNDIDAGIDSKSFDLTGVLGVGVDLPMGIRLDGRYNFGLTDVIEGGGESNGKNSVITLSAGYSFL